MINLDGQRHEDVARLVVHWPVRTLQTETLIDTPGIDSLSANVSERTHAFLTPEDEPSAADAIVYLLRHLHSSDLELPGVVPRPGRRQRHDGERHRRPVARR